MVLANEDAKTPTIENEKGLQRYFGRYAKHLGILPTRKLYEKSATLNLRQKPVVFELDAVLKQKHSKEIKLNEKDITFSSMLFRFSEPLQHNLFMEKIDSLLTRF